MRFSARRRATYKRRSKSLERQPSGALTKICSKPGNCCTAIGPNIDGSVGTTRQPKIFNVSFSNSSLSICFAACAKTGSEFKNIIPTA